MPLHQTRPTGRLTVTRPFATSVRSSVGDCPGLAGLSGHDPDRGIPAVLVTYDPGWPGLFSHNLYVTGSGWPPGYPGATESTGDTPPSDSGTSPRGVCHSPRSYVGGGTRATFGRNPC